MNSVISTVINVTCYIIGYNFVKSNGSPMPVQQTQMLIYSNMVYGTVTGKSLVNVFVNMNSQASE